MCESHAKSETETFDPQVNFHWFGKNGLSLETFSKANEIKAFEA